VPAVSVWSLLGLAAMLGVIGRLALRYRVSRHAAA